MNKRFKQFNAFTLAEVLITLGIIGVVAAMTMPTLIQNYKKQEYGAKLKKFNSVMEQAILSSKQDNGEVGEWNKASGDIKDDEGNVDYTANAAAIKSFVDVYLLPYIQILEFKEVTTDIEKTYGEAYIVFKDGSYLYLHNGGCLDLAYDINGKRPPNEYGKDVFKYVLCNKEYCSRYATESFCRQFTPIFPPFANNRATALDICERYPLTCSQLLKYDNYEFKDDYPYKL